jgi:hypothetical protein
MSADQDEQFAEDKKAQGFLTEAKTILGSALRLHFRRGGHVHHD